MSRIKKVLLQSLSRAEGAAEEQRLDQLDRAWNEHCLPPPTALWPLVRNGQATLDDLTRMPLYEIAMPFPHAATRGTKAEREALTSGFVSVPHPEHGYDIDTGARLRLVLGRWCLAHNLVYHHGEPLLLADRCEGWALIALCIRVVIATWPDRPSERALRTALASWATSRLPVEHSKEP